MTNNYDVIIIGGGIIGNSVAAHLANKKLKIAVINSPNLGMPASIAAAGLFQVQLGELENPALKPFCIQSYEYFLDFYKELTLDPLLENLNLGFNQSGSLYLVFSNSEIVQKENELRTLKEFNPKPYFVNKLELTKHEPMLTKDLLGAYHYPYEGYINNPRFLKAISSYCQQKKVNYLNNEVVEINISNGKIKNIVLDSSEILEADKFVLCNGTWANKLTNRIFNLKESLITGIKGEIVQLAIGESPLIEKVLLCHDGYIVPRPRTNDLESNTLIVGGTYEETDISDNEFTFNNTSQGISYLTGLLQKLLPDCKNLPILNTWSGVRPKTKDCLPILGQMGDIENLFCGLGHYRNGILMGPLSGKIISDLVFGSYTKYNIESFAFDRFIKDSSTLLNLR